MKDDLEVTFDQFETSTASGKFFDYLRFTKISGARFSRRIPQRDEAMRRRNDDHERFYSLHGRRARVLTVLTLTKSGDLNTGGLDDLMDTIEETSNLDWLLLMPKDARPAAFDQLSSTLGGIRRKVWLGAMLSTKSDADRIIMPLLSTPAEKHFVRVQPRGEIDFRQVRWWTAHPDIKVDVLRGGHWQDSGQVGKQGFVSVSDLPRLDWIVCGGGVGYACHPKWIRSLRDQALRAEVPIFFTGWGDYWPLSLDESGQSVNGMFPTGAGEVPNAIAEHAVWWPEADELRKSAGRLSDWYAVRVGPMLSGAVLDGDAWRQEPS
jgi:hypothetical protein